MEYTLFPDTTEMYFDDRFTFSVSPIKESGNNHVVGTATIFEIGNTYYLITAKHVLEVNDKDLQENSILPPYLVYFHKCINGKPQNTCIEFTITIADILNFGLIPNNELDLIAIPLREITNKKQDMNIYFSSISSSHILDNDVLMETFTSLTYVSMCGYPTGYYDKFNNLPMIRNGTTAIHPSFDVDEKSEGRAFIPNFTCDSGSPIVHLPLPIEYSKKLKVQIPGGLPFVFFGNTSRKYYHRISIWIRSTTWFC